MRILSVIALLIGCTDYGLNQSNNSTGEPDPDPHAGQEGYEEWGYVDGEYCNGVDTVCGNDDFEPSTVICRQRAHDCDVQDFCTGQSADCPVDQLAPNGTPCGPGVCLDGICDLPNDGGDQDGGEDGGGQDGGTPDGGSPDGGDSVDGDSDAGDDDPIEELRANSTLIAGGCGCS